MLDKLFKKITYSYRRHTVPPRNTEKVFCIGLGKTGTTTFRDCMRYVGFRHLSGPFSAGQALDILGCREVFYDVAVHYDSFDDHPWPFFYHELAEWFPCAKFVLTTRSSPEDWFDSVVKHYERNGPLESWYFLCGDKNPKNQKEKLINFYKSHNDEVRSYFNNSSRFMEVCWEKSEDFKIFSDFLGFENLAVAELPHSNSAVSKDPMKTLQRLVNRGAYSHAIWYAKNRTDNEEKYLCELAKILESKTVAATINYPRFKKIRNIITR